MRSQASLPPGHDAHEELLQENPDLTCGRLARYRISYTRPAESRDGEGRLVGDMLVNEVGNVLALWVASVLRLTVLYIWRSCA